MIKSRMLLEHVRILLDCLLILILLLVLAPTAQGALVKPVQSASVIAEPIAEWPADISTNIANLSLERALYSPGQVTLDNATTAAMFAAENAALTLLQYNLGLPLVRH